jgi:uncharacterized membrane protein YedE/YeeE
MALLTSFLTGLLFGVGLIVSGMTDPSRIIGFLDLAGAWDPSLAFVMAGAVLVGAAGFRLAERRPTSVLGGLRQLPGTRGIDARLILGSTMFGVGWGLAGFCPGPALVAFGAGYDKAVVFVIALLAGMVMYEFTERRRMARATDE